jgi:hypothetical protein
MGTLKVLVGTAVIAMAAGMTTACGYMESFDDPCYKNASVDMDYVRIMSADTAEFLSDWGYVPVDKCGGGTNSYTAFPIWIGTCKGTFFSHKGKDFQIIRESLVGRSGPKPKKPVDRREDLPTADQLIEGNPLYKDCAP